MQQGRNGGEGWEEELVETQGKVKGKFSNNDERLKNLKQDLA